MEDFVGKEEQKRRRLPNGFGQISKIENRNLRNPYRAMVTVGKTPEGKPIVKPLKPQSYFRTYNEAYQALLKYNSNPYDLSERMTMNDLFDNWFEEHAKKIGEQSAKNIRYDWAHATQIHNISVVKLRPEDVRALMDNKNISLRIRRRVRGTLISMLDYAITCELVPRNVAK